MNYIFLINSVFKTQHNNHNQKRFDEQNFVTSKWDHEPKMGLGTTALVPL